MQNWVLGPSWYIPMPPISMKSKMLLYQTHFSQEGVQAERGGEAAHQGQCWKWTLEIDVLTLSSGLHAPVAYKEWDKKKRMIRLMPFFTKLSAHTISYQLAATLIVAT